MDGRWSEPDWGWAELCAADGSPFDDEEDSDLSGQDLIIRVYTEPLDGVFDSDDYTPQRLTFPFTPTQFWDAFRALDEAVDDYRRARYLPTLDSADEFWEGIDEFADFFGTDAMSLFGAIGGGWRSIEGPGQGWTTEIVQSWYVVGDPIQVLMGIGGRAVVFGRPDLDYGFWENQITGIEQSYRMVPLGEEDLVAALGVACRLTHVENIRGWAVCHGCRRFADNTQPSGEDPYCRDCLAHPQEKESEYYDAEELAAMSQDDLMKMADEYDVEIPKALREHSDDNHQRIVEILMDSGEE